MTEPKFPRIVQIEPLYGGVAVTFDDEQSGFFSRALLHSILPQAVDLRQTSAHLLIAIECKRRR
jgi:hypothetical protein